MKSYKLELTRQAESALSRIASRDPKLYKRMVQVLDDLQHDPFEGQALKGQLKGRYSYRVGTYRIAYSIFRHQLIVVVIDVGHRRDIYR